MSAPSPRFREIFLEVYRQLPRQGPGDRVSAARALALCRGLPAAPAILDLGSGVGGQSFHLVELTGGEVTAVDLHTPWIELLARRVEERGLGARIHPRVGDLRALELPAQSFDLVWSEGALYNVGIDTGLRISGGLLRPGGCLVFSDAVWTEPGAPPAVRAMFADYAEMGTVQALLEKVDRAGLELLGHFTLPEEAWWADYYRPMERELALLRAKYSGDPEALEALELIAAEPELRRKYSRYYDYELVAARHTQSLQPPPKPTYNAAVQVSECSSCPKEADAVNESKKRAKRVHSKLSPVLVSAPTIYGPATPQGEPKDKDTPP